MPILEKYLQKHCFGQLQFKLSGYDFLFKNYLLCLFVCLCEDIGLAQI